jgi:hypothetical protein
VLSWPNLGNIVAFTWKNGRKLSQIEKDLEGCYRGLMWVLSRQLPGRTEENYPKLRRIWKDVIVA